MIQGTGRKREMKEGSHLIAARNIIKKPALIVNPYSSYSSYTQKIISHSNSKSKFNTISVAAASASSKRNIDHHQHHQLPLPLITKKKSSKNISRRLITISTTDGRWHGEWKSDYLVSLRDLQLQDLVEDDTTSHPDARVSINLSVQKHASFGFSVDGRILTSFTRKCSNCSSPYCRQIDASFNVWVLSSSREKKSIQLPEIGGDPSVIYVKPGYPADLDSLIQDTIRLNTTVKDTCSELCEKSEPKLQYIGAKSSASVDKRWGRLLELRNAKS